MKRVLLLAGVLITATIAAFNVNVVENESGDISLQNAEILSYGETGNTVGCFYAGSLNCPVNEAKVYLVW